MHKTLIVIVVVAACVVAISAQVVCPKECLGLAGGSPVTEDKLQSAATDYVIQWLNHDAGRWMSSYQPTTSLAYNGY
ncbi:uncharacterized protein LOC126284563 isoform X5 [Schistocerca gregaria]|uniref:uncharacterized protein LOC126284563 isoform X5 n=1 Tax=Schistocerca gregaria TaxID=7010 RepID=UPI00211DC0FA|nr:uncharacterized protein LOC126284563 isoform X5 [Schistocerca gregaria]